MADPLNPVIVPPDAGPGLALPGPGAAPNGQNPPLTLEILAAELREVRGQGQDLIAENARLKANISKLQEDSEANAAITGQHTQLLENRIDLPAGISDKCPKIAWVMIESHDYNTDIQYVIQAFDSLPESFRSSPALAIGEGALRRLERRSQLIHAACQAGFDHGSDETDAFHTMQCYHLLLKDNIKGLTGVFDPSEPAAKRMKLVHPVQKHINEATAMVLRKGKGKGSGAASTSLAGSGGGGGGYTGGGGGRGRGPRNHQQQYYNQPQIYQGPPNYPQQYQQHPAQGYGPPPPPMHNRHFGGGGGGSGFGGPKHANGGFKARN